ncbi:hypothetical protein ECG_09135 [Echinococcus granulosus]|uniref:Uncharacterized protein n=1 Tax=Echinococcus granulosus TaxID=6210 RepID=U6JD37_ECHGR|nr:hypothetical protein EGR_11075 [Echinococcus granulosus]EUB54067.1 hypothetical protein EGR_11075 [Echinococcus granulosus]KAH9278477.1 hypothetical protein ECG_09135 [Echinococcus granulosus]CDS21269.1 hypothetical protein EgrG_000166100 [Echinococcus granulosus]
MPYIYVSTEPFLPITLKRLPSEALIHGQLGNSFLVCISDCCLGYIVSHVASSGACTHVFLHLLKPLITGANNISNWGEWEQWNGSGDVIHNSTICRDHSVVNRKEEKEEGLYPHHPIGQSFPPVASSTSSVTVSSSPPFADYFAFLFYRNYADYANYAVF